MMEHIFMSVRKEYARGNGHQCPSQQKILVKVDRGKAIGFLTNEAFKKFFRKVTFF